MQHCHSFPQLQEATPAGAACEEVIDLLCRSIYYKGSQSLRWVVAPGHLLVRSKSLSVSKMQESALVCFHSFHFHLLRGVPQPREVESSKVETKAKALTDKTALENIHGSKMVCTFPACGRPETQPSDCKGSPGTSARAPHSRTSLNFVSLWGSFWPQNQPWKMTIPWFSSLMPRPRQTQGQDTFRKLHNIDSQGHTPVKSEVWFEDLWLAGLVF